MQHIRYTDDVGTHGFVRSPEGMIASFDPPTEATGCLSPGNPFGLSPAVFPTRINQQGVITGWCFTGNPGELCAIWMGTLPVILRGTPISFGGR